MEILSCFIGDAILSIGPRNNLEKFSNIDNCHDMPPINDNRLMLKVVYVYIIQTMLFRRILKKKWTE